MPAFNVQIYTWCVLFYGAKNLNTNNNCYTKLLTRTYIFICCCHCFQDNWSRALAFALAANEREAARDCGYAAA